MPVSIIKAPATTKAHYKASETSQLQTALKAIEAKYGKYILKASLACNVESAIITSFIFVESAGQQNIVSSAKAYGLMQLKLDTAISVIHLEAKNKRLTATEYETLVEYLGRDRVECYTKTMKNLGQDQVNKCKPMTPKELMMPGLNILIGTMMIGRLMDETREGNEFRIDKVYFKYNQGLFYKFKSKKYSDINKILQEAKKRSSESYAGILKLVGKNGVLDILT
ncbi:MAG: hypothetical protein EXR21_09075 [Flavobacteriaceae bacterium]|nr:hypothetical protein [Flavobacteriaceae bacterium]